MADEDFVLNFAASAPSSKRGSTKVDAATKTKPSPNTSQNVRPVKSKEASSKSRIVSPLVNQQGGKTTAKQQQQQQQAPTRPTGPPAPHRAGGGPRGSRPVVPPDEDEMVAADDDEEGDVAQVVAAALQRDKQIQLEMAAASRPAGRRLPKGHDVDDEEAVGVVEFGDARDSDDEAAARQRVAKKRPAGSQVEDKDASRKRPTNKVAGKPAAAVGTGGTSGTSHLVRHVPGMRRHADTHTPSATTEQIFGVPSSTTTAATAAGVSAPPGSVSAWSALGVCPSLVQQLGALQFATPTVTQQAALPPMLGGRDVLVRAPTGSGKTLSYLVPLINDLMNLTPRVSRQDGTLAVVVAPVRELCLQINDVAISLLRPIWWLVPGMIIGGENRSHEKARLRKGLSVLTASPGRLLDHLQNTAAFKSGRLRWLVLDEADRLLDLGFQAKLQSICDLLDERCRTAGGTSGDTAGGTSGDTAGGTTGGTAVQRRRQTVLLSATLHSQLSSLAGVSLHDPVAVGFVLSSTSAGQLSVGLEAPPGDRTAAVRPATGASPEEDLDAAGFSIPTQLRQWYLEVGAKDRLMTLAALIRQRVVRRQAGRPAKMVVFLSSCDSVEWHCRALGPVWAAACGAGLLPPAAPLLQLHGDMPQAQRTATFATFSEADLGVLLCTDVAARGLDFPAVSTIIQYDVPGATAEYVHRVGRTARMGHAGEALLFLLPTERDYVKMLAGRGIELRPMDAGEPLLKWLPLLQADERDMAAGEGAGFGGGGGATRGGAKGGRGDREQQQGSRLAFRLHQRLQATIASDPALKQLASDAFRSYVRAYAAHGGEVKRIFHVRQLHLGHVAFSFGLRETPSMLGQSGSAVERKRKKAEAAEGLKRRNKKKTRVAATRVAGMEG